MTTTTRRNLLRIGTTAAAYAAGATIVTGGVAIASQAKGAEPERTTWDRLCADYYAKHAVEDRLLSVSDELQGRWYDAAAKREPAPKLPNSGPLDTSLSLAEIVAQGRTPEAKAEATAHAAAVAKWKAEHDAAEAAFMSGAEARYDAALEETQDVFAKIRNFPVSSLAMLSEKAAVFKHRYEDNLEASEALALMADIDRLAVNGAA